MRLRAGRSTRKRTAIGFLSEIPPLSGNRQAGALPGYVRRGHARSGTPARNDPAAAVRVPVKKEEAPVKGVIPGPSSRRSSNSGTWGLGDCRPTCSFSLFAGSF